MPIWGSLHKIPTVWGSKHFQVGEHIRTRRMMHPPQGYKDRSSCIWALPDLTLCIFSPGCSTLSFNKLVNTLFLTTYSTQLAHHKLNYCYLIFPRKWCFGTTEIVPLGNWPLLTSSIWVWVPKYRMATHKERAGPHKECRTKSLLATLLFSEFFTQVP